MLLLLLVLAAAVGPALGFLLRPPSPATAAGCVIELVIG